MQNEKGVNLSKFSILPKEAEQKTAQEKYDSLYVSCPEIVSRVGVSRASMSAKLKQGIFGDPIKAGGNLLIWERTPEIEETIEAWVLSVKQRKAVKE